MRDAHPPGRDRSVLPWNMRAARMVKRLALPFMLGGVVLLWMQYGVLTVPDGMDTMPDTHPPGTRCLVEKTPRRVPVGAVIFVDVRGGTMLSRVDALTEGGIMLKHDNTHSRFADLQERPVPLSAVRGLVLVSLSPTPEAPRGR